MIPRAAVFAVTLGMLALSAVAAARGETAPPLEGRFALDFSLLDPPVPAPLASFEDLEGARVRLADFRGRVVLLNFWATWCAPCIREMPSLDRLQAALGGEGLLVAAVSIDRGGRGVVVPFAAKLGIANMRLYLDTRSVLARAFGLSGLPTSFLIDGRGRIVGAITGPAEWDTPEAIALVRHYLKGLPQESRQSTAGGAGARIAQRVGTGLSPE